MNTPLKPRYRFLDGAGEMGKRIEDFQWKNTPIGSIEHWPFSLKNTLRTVLHSAFPMLVLWGKDLTCFYNDAYRPVLGAGGKHPFTLGKPVKDAYPETWEFIRPLFQNVLRTCEAVKMEDQLVPIYRNGKLEDVYWTFSYSALFDEEGETAGILIVCNETTTTVTKFRNVINQSKGPIVIFKGEELIIEEANQATLHLWQVGPDAIGKPFVDVVPEMKDQAFPDLLRNVYQTGENYYGYGVPAYFYRTGGEKETLFFNFEYSPYREASGSISGVLVIATDVTSEVHTKQQLLIAEEEIRGALEAGDLGYWNLNPLTNIFNCNNKTKQLFGLPEQKEVDLQMAIKAIHEEDQPRVIAALEKALQYESGGSFDSEYRVYSVSEKKWYHIRSKGQAYFNEEKKAYRFSGTVHDISENKTHEAALLEQEKRFRTLAQNSPDIITRHDKDLRYLYASPSIEKVTGIPAENFAGKTYREAGLPEDLCTFFDQHLTHVFSTQKQHQVEFKVPGADQHILTRLVPEWNEAGEVDSVMAISTDITEQKKAEEQLKKSESRYRSIFEGVPVALFEEDFSGAVTRLYEWQSVHQENLRPWLLQHPEEVRTLLSLVKVKDANHEALRLFEADEKEQLLNGLLSVKTKEALPTFVDELMALSRRDQSFTGEYTLRTLKGNRVHCLVTTAIAGPDLTSVLVSRVDISGRVKAEEALRESEEKFRSTFNNAAVGIAHVGLDGTWLLVNDRTCEIVGYSHEEMRSCTFQDITHPEDIRSDLELLQQVLDGRLDTYAMEKRYYHKKGHIVWVNLTVSLVRNNEGAPCYFISIIEDINERKQTEAAQIASEDLFRSFSNNIQNLAWIADGNGWIYWYNQRWFDYTGTTLEEMQGWGWEKVHHPLYRDGVVDYVKEAWKRNEPFELTFPLRSASGDYCWFLTRAVPIIDKNGNVSRWIGTNTNIHEQITLAENLEERIAERTGELSQSRAFLQAVLNSAQSTISTFEAIRNEQGVIVDFRLTYINDLIREELGNEADSFLGKPCQECFPHIFTSGEFERFVHRVETGEALQYETCFEQEDATAWYLVSLAKLGDGLTSTSLNMTKEKKAAQQLAELNKQLDERNQELQHSNAELQQYAYVSSHDLQEPLRKISLFIQRIERQDYAILSDNSKRLFEKISEATERMRESLRDLLDYASLGREVEFEPVDLNLVINGILKDLEAAIAQKEASLQVDEMPVIKAIPLQMQQLFYNLVGNALKYTRTGVAPVIQVTARLLDAAAVRQLPASLQLAPERPYYEFKVQDNGIGFEEQYAAQIFTIFKRLHSKQEFSGTGIGLALCRKVVQNHGGAIYATAKEGAGATFAVLLPENGI